MKMEKIFIILTFILLSMVLVTVGCGGQKSTTQRSQETAAPSTSPSQTTTQQTPATTSTSTTAPSAGVTQTPVETRPTYQSPAPPTHPAESTQQTAEQAQQATKPAATVAAPAATATQPAPVQQVEQTPPQPPPQPIEVTIPSGTVLDVVFLDTLSSKTSKIGDTFRGEVKKEIIQDGWVAIPVGSIVKGTITEAVPLKKIGGQASLSMEFSTLEIQSGAVPIKASFAEKGKSETGKDAATIGGAAAGGALLGRILGKDNKGKATVIGAILGAAAGTAIAAKTQGQEVEIPKDTEISLQLTEPVKISVIP